MGRSLDFDEDGSHVIAADAGHGVWSYQSFQQIFYYFLGVFLLEVLFYNIYDSLVILHIILPNTIAAQQDELVTLLSLKIFHVRLACYHLLIIGQRLALVIEIP
jgi:hypothetical protein